MRCTPHLRSLFSVYASWTKKKPRVAAPLQGLKDAHSFSLNDGELKSVNIKISNTVTTIKMQKVNYN